MNEDLIRNELGDGEKLMWQGRPANRFLTKHELYRVPVSALLIVAFIIYWFARSDTNTTMVLIMVAALLYVSYSTLSALFIKYSRRKRTGYAMTDSRLIFILADKDGNLKESASVEIAKFFSNALDLNKDGTGSILFSEKKPVDMLPLRTGSNWSTRFKVSFATAAFFDIDRPEDVLNTYKEVYGEAHKNEEKPADKPFSKYDE